jgi:hypothetical protein
MTFIFFPKFSELFSHRFKTFGPSLRFSCDRDVCSNVVRSGASMKIVPGRRQLADEVAQEEDTTTEFPTGPEQIVHRRTTVTVERETVSFLVRRPVVEALIADAVPATSSEDAMEKPYRLLPAALPEQPDEASGGKP